MSNLSCPWGIRAKHAMLDRGLSVSGLAKAIGASRVYISGILSGRVYSDKMIDRISAFLDIANDYSVTYLKQAESLPGQISLYENADDELPSAFTAQLVACTDDELPVDDEAESGPSQISRFDFIFAEDPAIFETMPIDE